jgi:glucan phosphoethanolaminetransferase (alkaline phosphatase superfamily)
MTLKKSFYLWLCGAAFLSYLVHEGAHWLMGASFGLHMEFGINAVRYLSPLTPWQKAMTDGAGPLVTILQAIVAYALVQRTRAPLAFAFLYFAAFMRVVAALISLVMPNDEARLSAYLGLGMWTLPLLVGGALVALVWKASRQLQLTWKDQLLCYLAASVVTTLIVVLDRVLR